MWLGSSVTSQSVFSPSSFCSAVPVFDHRSSWIWSISKTSYLHIMARFCLAVFAPPPQFIYSINLCVWKILTCKIGAFLFPFTQNCYYFMGRRGRIDPKNTT
uniref:Uncharacterized protein n=1 Tax=Sphaerodactylus townsendi TaxID=933632 RepID=A0ACB8FTR4_9SAUR